MDKVIKQAKNLSLKTVHQDQEFRTKMKTTGITIDFQRKENDRRSTITFSPMAKGLIDSVDSQTYWLLETKELQTMT